MNSPAGKQSVRRARNTMDSWLESPARHSASERERLVCGKGLPIPDELGRDWASILDHIDVDFHDDLSGGGKGV